MESSNWIYHRDPTNRFRYILGVKGQNMLAIIGANPSTAIPEKPDRTVMKIQKIALNNGYDGWLLFNLWPERETHPDHLRKRILNRIHLENIGYIEQALQRYPVGAIWAAWGNIIEKRPYLYRCLKDLAQIEPCKKLPWLQHSPPTRSGHPRHPLYLPDNAVLSSFDPRDYIANYSN